MLRRICFQVTKVPKTPICKLPCRASVKSFNACTSDMKSCCCLKQVAQYHTSLILQKKKASGTQKRKNTKKSGQASMANEEDFDEADLISSPDELVDLAEFATKLTHHIALLQEEYAEKLILRTNQSAFTHLKVKLSDGQHVGLQYLGQVTTKGANTININLATNPQHVSAVRDALINSALNVNPRIDGTTIYVEIPRVSRENREKMAKNAKSLCDKAKDHMRNEQNAVLKVVKAGKSIFSIDDLKRIEEKIMDETKKYMKKAEDVMKAKQNELLS